MIFDLGFVVGIIGLMISIFVISYFIIDGIIYNKCNSLVKGLISIGIFIILFFYTIVSAKASNMNEKLVKNTNTTCGVIE